MKKITYNIFMMLTMILLSASTATAKPINLDDTKAVTNAIIGEWALNVADIMDEMPEGMETADATIHFQKGDQVTLLIFVSGQAEGISLKIKVTANGKWTLNDRKINIGKMKSKLELTDIILPEEYKMQLAAMGMNEDSLKKMFESKMENPLDDNSLIGDLIIESINDTTMTLTDDEGKTATLKRK